MHIYSSNVACKKCHFDLSGSYRRLYIGDCKSLNNRLEFTKSTTFDVFNSVYDNGTSVDT